MHTKTKLALAAAILFASMPAFAQETVVAGSDWAQAFRFLGAGLAIAIPVLGGTFAQGRAAATAYEGIARNPQAADKLFTPLLLGLALIEFQAILGFIIAILLVTGA